MSLKSLTIATVLATTATAALAQTADPRMTSPVVHAGLFTIRPDGSIGGHAGDAIETAGAEIFSVVALSPCATTSASSADSPISAAATDVWRLSGRVSELTAERASLQITWQRLRKGGLDVADAAQSVSFTLGRGERRTLDAVDVAARGTCGPRRSSLDVVLASRSELYPFSTAPVASFGAGGGVANVGVGAGDAAFRSATAGTRVSGGGGGRSEGVMVAGSGGGGGTERSPMLKQADLWLVGTRAGQADTTLHTNVPHLAAPQRFAFTPVTIRSTSGTLTVAVQGTVEAGLSPEGEPRLFLTANRSVTFVPVNQPARDAVPVVEGSTKTAVAMPGPDEVLSFEMPPLRVPGGAALPDRLSIRVKVSALPLVSR